MVFILRRGPGINGRDKWLLSTVSEGCNFLSMYLIPDSGTQVFIYIIIKVHICNMTIDQEQMNCCLISLKSLNDHSVFLVIHYKWRLRILWTKMPSFSFLNLSHQLLVTYLIGSKFGPGFVYGCPSMLWCWIIYIYIYGLVMFCCDKIR